IIYEENRIFQKEKELDLTRINSALMENMINEIRRTQHQYDNRINALTSLASVCKDYDTLKNEILKNTDIMLNDNTDYDVLKLNLKLVAALIFSKINQAKESGITLSIEIKNYSLSTKVPEYDLIDIIGIMINNMLEATPDNSACTLTLNSIDDKLLIQTKNEGPKLTTELQNKLFSQGYTTKQNETDNKKRGYGLYNLRKTVLKYGGSFSVMNEYSADRLKTYIVFTVEV
nr:GHKL domain-containing protein [Lachnospiraceae bacterium]